MPIGTTTTLGGSTALTSVAFTVHRIWIDATPELYEDSSGNTETLTDLLNALFTPLHLPLHEQLAWVGLDFTATNNGPGRIEGFTATGQGVPSLNFIINRYVGTDEAGGDSAFAVTGFEVGVPGCPFPRTSTSEFGIQGFLAAGQTWSGCVALAVPAGVNVFSAGFVLGPYLPGYKFALWSL